MERTYLLLVVSPSLEPEHRAVAEAVSRHSSGNCVEVFKQAASLLGARAAKVPIPFTVGYLFTTAKLPSEMGFGLLSADRYLLLPISPGPRWLDGFAVARSWLDRQDQHRTPS